ncbi:MAG: peptidase M14, partial [Oscillospiraceae bacterium]|nr:peptidase M14 [Oscillospiraceae bacterium]
MAIVKTDVPLTAQSCEDMILSLVRTYPFLRSEVLTTTVFGRRIRTLVIGSGPRKVLYTAAHHANEWITALILLKFAEEFAQAIAQGGEIFGENAKELAQNVTIYMVPMVDPDGVDLVV